jgi:beta-barrel assembly-enhancing protease
MNRIRSATKLITLQIVLAIVMTPFAGLAQTPIKVHGNKFKPEDDVKLGQEAAAEAEKKLNVINDPDLNAYIARVGEGLAAAIPQEFQQPAFRYSFKVVSAKEINAFALPGGPMYVNTGMIAAAKSEDEMAGVMAHEISHVALRHGTAQVTKAQKYSTLSSILGMGGAIVGGPLGQVAQMGSQGVGMYLLKYSREYETEADLLGARIMAQAGYDPRQLANMFQTIESQGGGGGGWFSDHPSAKDRYAKINQEAQMLQINTAATPDKQDFIAAQQRVTGQSNGQAFSANQAIRQSPQPRTRVQGASSDVHAEAVAQTTNQSAQPRTTANSIAPRAASSTPGYETVDKGLFAVSIPSNWQEVEQQNGVWFAPQGGFSSANGQAVFTHAVNLGVAQTRGQNTQQASEEFVNGLKQRNKLKVHTGYEPMNIDKRPGRLIVLENVNELTGRPEFVVVVMTQLRDGTLFYLIAVSPKDEYPKYQPTFATILGSVRLNDVASP